MRAEEKTVWVVGAKRTAFGAFGGALAAAPTTTLGAHATRAALAQSAVPADRVDHVIFGNVVQAFRNDRGPPAGLPAWGGDAYCARHVGLEAGRFSEEMVSIELPSRVGHEIFSRDEHPRPDSCPDKLRRLKPVFKPDGVVTAGNASGIADGAAAIVVTSRSFAEQSRLTPLARLVSGGVAGVEPTRMGVGPVPAMAKALAGANLTMADMDLIEVNEAFARRCWRSQGSPSCPTNASTSTGARSRSATRWGPAGPASLPTWFTSCAADGLDTGWGPPASAVAKGLP